MHILLLNANPVVSRLFSLCVRDEDIVLDEITNASHILQDTYDIVFVDDASMTEEIQSKITTLNVKKKVFLSGKTNHENLDLLFDDIIFKPFLPSQITTVLENMKQEDTKISNEDSENFIFPLSTGDEDIIIEEDETTSYNEENIDLLEVEELSVLDSVEIEKIKSLLEEDDKELESIAIEDGEDYESKKIEVIKQQLEADGLEIVSEEEYVESLQKKKKKKKSKKEKKSKKSKKSTKKVFTFEEALIAAVEGMKIKKIKKLLKGADINIQITFKDSDAK